jgi:hypothetical protein
MGWYRQGLKGEEFNVPHNGDKKTNPGPNILVKNTKLSFLGARF